YDYGRAAALILGGSTVAAMLVGFLYGRGKRVWCRHLCPVSGVFSLLARLAPVHYKVDEERWQANQGPHLPTPNCAPLIDIRRMQGNSDCHACGGCRSAARRWVWAGDRKSTRLNSSHVKIS